MDEPPTPAGIGPHEGRELALMLARLKPLAEFLEDGPDQDLVPREDFLPYVAAGLIICEEKSITIRQKDRTEIIIKFVYYALPGQEWRISALHRINVTLLDDPNSYTTEIERIIGQLLGYSEADIETFITWIAAHKPPRTNIL